MDHTDPPDLWISTDDDPVPDPRDLDAMLEYCDMNKSELTASVYMVTREMVESGMEVLPLASYEPYIARKSCVFLYNMPVYSCIPVMCIIVYSCIPVMCIIVYSCIATCNVHTPVHVDYTCIL